MPTMISGMRRVEIEGDGMNERRGLGGGEADND